MVVAGLSPPAYYLGVAEKLMLAAMLPHPAPSTPSNLLSVVLGQRKPILERLLAGVMGAHAGMFILLQDKVAGQLQPVNKSLTDVSEALVKLQAMQLQCVHAAVQKRKDQAAVRSLLERKRVIVRQALAALLAAQSVSMHSLDVRMGTGVTSLGQQRELLDDLVVSITTSRIMNRVTAAAVMNVQADSNRQTQQHLVRIERRIEDVVTEYGSTQRLVSQSTSELKALIMARSWGPSTGAAAAVAGPLAAPDAARPGQGAQVGAAAAASAAALGAETAVMTTAARAAASWAATSEPQAAAAAAGGAAAANSHAQLAPVDLSNISALDYLNSLHRSDSWRQAAELSSRPGQRDNSWSSPGLVGRDSRARASDGAQVGNPGTDVQQQQQRRILTSLQSLSYPGDPHVSGFSL